MSMHDQIADAQIDLGCVIENPDFEAQPNARPYCDTHGLDVGDDVYCPVAVKAVQAAFRPPATPTEAMVEAGE